MSGQYFSEDALGVVCTWLRNHNFFLLLFYKISKKHSFLYSVNKILAINIKSIFLLMISIAVCSSDYTVVKIHNIYYKVS